MMKLLKIVRKIEEISNEVSKKEINCFLSGENDDLNIFLKYMLVQEGLKAKTGLIC